MSPGLVLLLEVPTPSHHMAFFSIIPLRGSRSCAKVATTAAGSAAMPCMHLAHQWGEAHIRQGRGKKDSTLHRKPYNDGVLLLTTPTLGCRHTKYSHFLL